MFNDVKWLSHQQRRDFHKCILDYKCTICLAPQYIHVICLQLTSATFLIIPEIPYSLQLPKPELLIIIIDLLYLF